MLKFKNAKATLSAYKDGEKSITDLIVNNVVINNTYIPEIEEGQKVECIIDGNSVYSLNRELIATYDNVIKDVIGILEVKDGRGIIKVGNEEVANIECDLKRDHYHVNIKNDNDYTIVRYANLHQHTDNSVLDGIVKIKELAKKSEYACAITDHGTMSGWYDMLNSFNKLGKKAIIGEEFYIETFGGPRPILDADDVDTLMFDNVRQQNEDGLNGEHLIVLAKNNVGLKNLFKLSTMASEHFHRKPHITYEELKKHKEGLIVCSACIAGGVSQFIKEYLKCAETPVVKNWIEAYGEIFFESEEYINSWHGGIEEVYVYNYKKAREVIEWFYHEFQDDFYLEYQDHNFPLEKLIMDELVRIRDEEFPQIKIVATCDAHYLNKEDAFVHELWLCNQTNKKLSDKNRMRFSGDGYYVHTSEEMLAKFPAEYLDNTLEVADKVYYEPFVKQYHLPHFPLPSGFKDEVEYFRYVCRQGFKEKFQGTDLYKSKEYLGRMVDEINTIVNMGWASYFLIVSDFIRWAEDDKVYEHPEIYFPHVSLEEIPQEILKDYPIYVGTGRGSGAGSLVNFVLGITKIDPIKYDLKFERFLNPDRISMPDIDTDFEDALRPKVLEYVRFKYGRKKVANVITFNTAAAKNSIKTINRVLGGSVNRGNEITSYVPDTPGMTIEKAMFNQQFKKMYETDKEARKIIDLAKRVEGLKTARSIHPCAVIICDNNITDYMPECLMKTKEGTDEWTVQMEGPICEELGCLKMDFLGLRTLGYVHEAISLIKKNSGKDIIYDDIPLNDVEVYKHLAKGHTASIFQIESDMFTTVIKKTLKDVETANGDECFNRLVAMNALVRPGSNQFIDDFADRILNPEHIEYLVPELEPILKETYGIILYQEQTMRITRDLAGFSMGQADTVRKAMGKKKKYIMDEYKDYFVHGNVAMGIKGCVKNGINEKKASELWDIMALASQYSFNKSHAVAYSMHSIRTAWLSYYYPYEYMTAVLNSYADDTDKLAQYLSVARRSDMIIHAPSLNKSGLNFTTDGSAIIGGLSGIKSVSSSAIDIIAERNKGEFSDMKEFLDRMSYYGSFSKRTLEALIYAGVLDELCGTRLNKLNNLDEMATYVKKLKEHRKKLLEFKQKMSDFENGTLKRQPKEPKVPVLNMVESEDELDEFDKLIKEKEYTGMFLTGNPMDLFLIDANNCSNISRGKTTVCGIVVEAEKKTSKAGSTFYTFTIENEGLLKCILFNYNGEIEKNMVLELSGTVSVDEFGATLKVQNLTDIKKQQDLVLRLEDICITVDDEATGKALRKIKFPAGKRNIYVEFKNKRHIFMKNVSIDFETAGLLIENVGLKRINFC